jgi:hypothetical protein
MPAPFVTPTQLAAIVAADRYDGMPLLVRDGQLTQWVEFVAASTDAAVAGLVYAPTAGTGRYHVIDRNSAIPLLVADGATIASNARVTSNFTIAMVATQVSRQIADPTNLRNGQLLRFRLQQPTAPPVGGCKITVGPKWVVSNLDLNPAANAYSILEGVYYSDIDKILGNIIKL